MSPKNAIKNINIQSLIQSILVLFGPFCHLQSIWFNLAHSVLFNQLRFNLVHSIHIGPYSLYFGLIRSIQSTLALFGPHWSYFVLFSQFYPLWSYSVYYLYFGSISSYSVQSAHFDPLQSYSDHLVLFGPFCPLCPIQSTLLLFS